MIFFARLRDLELTSVYQSVMFNLKYIAGKFQNDAVKERALDNARWERNFDYAKIIWPLLRMIKLADLQKPVMSKIVGRVKLVEE